MWDDEARTLNEAPMLDVHPPHEAAHTWKDFFIHVATICVGLLIAVGLEQTVEWLHRRHEVAETRHALAIERRININHFAATTEQFERFVPILQKNLAVFVALRQHPGSAESLPQLDWNGIYFTMQDGAWQTAKQTNVLESMPVAEAREEDALYRRLEFLNEDNDAESKAIVDATLYAVADPDLSHLSAEQLDHQIELTARVLQVFRTTAVDQNNLNNQFPDFSPGPRRQQVQAIRHLTPSPQWLAYSKKILDGVYSCDKTQTAESSPSK
jgi:hypothetical protein